MKNIWVTGERGYIAYLLEKNLDVKVVNSINNTELDYFRQTRDELNNEIDIFDPTLYVMMERNDVDLIVNAATCRTFDKPDNILRCHIEGTYYVMKAAKELNIPMINILEYTDDPDVYKTKTFGAGLTQTYYDKCYNIYIDQLFGIHNFNRNINKLVNDNEKDIYVNIDKNNKYLCDFYFTEFMSTYIEGDHFYKNALVNGAYKKFSDIIDMFSETSTLKDFNIIDDFDDSYDQWLPYSAYDYINDDYSGIDITEILGTIRDNGND